MRKQKHSCDSLETASRVAVLFCLALTLSCLSTYGAGKVWVSNGPEGGAIKAMAVDPADSQSVYAGTASGLFKSTNGAGTWIAVSGGLTGSNVNDIAVDPDTPQTL